MDGGEGEGLGGVMGSQQGSAAADLQSEWRGAGGDRVYVGGWGKRWEGAADLGDWKKRRKVGWLKCCFTSTETVGLFGMGAQDVHLDFHTAPEL